MDDEERVLEVLKKLREEYPETHGTALSYDNPIQLLIATILSAQSTDETVNKITPKLFKRYKTVEDFAEADRQELEKIIFSSGYFRNKAKWIQKASKKLVTDYDSEVPKDIEKLTDLPGVGRKTANVVLSKAFGITQGVVVDTHVQRLSRRLGFSSAKNPQKIEKDLMELLPKNLWDEFSTLLIRHGRKVCDALNPRCKYCIISSLCPSAFTFD